MNNWVDLYLESASDYRITQVRGKESTTITLEQARQVWDAGRVRDFNLAFDRLARANFDLDAVKAYYARDAQ